MAGCGCGGGPGKGGTDTIGFYVILPNGGGLLPEGVNPEEPEKGTPPYPFIQSANAQVTLHRGGTIRRIKRKPAPAA